MVTYEARLTRPPLSDICVHTVRGPSGATKLVLPVMGIGASPSPPDRRPRSTFPSTEPLAMRCDELLGGTAPQVVPEGRYQAVTVSVRLLRTSRAPKTE